MMACCSKGDIEQGNCFLSTLRNAFKSIYWRTRRTFWKPKCCGSSLTEELSTVHQSSTINATTTNTNAISLVTPNHLPLNDKFPKDINDNVTVITLEGSRHDCIFEQCPSHQGSSLKDDVKVSPIGISGKHSLKCKSTTVGIKSKNATIIRPIDLWRQDQMTISSGRYTLEPIFATKYTLKQMLGEGSFGFVWVAERVRDQREVAVKFILREKVAGNNWIFNGELGLVPMEVHILKRMMHRNIIQFLDFYSDYRFVYLVTEMHGTSWTWPNPRIDPRRNPGLRPSGQLMQLTQSSSSSSEDTIIGVPGVTRRPPCDLFECIEAHVKLPEATVRKLFSQLLDAVYYLYSMGIVHRDLKDENIVVDEDYNIKLIDFGSASYVPYLYGRRTIHDSLSSSSSECNLNNNINVTFDAKLEEGYFERFNGTLAFAAPEIVKGLKYRPSEAEVWSLGILLYTMIFKKSPFSSTEAILHSPIDLPLEAQPGPFDLLRKMLQKSPPNRIRLEEIFNHPFLSSGR